MKYSKIPKTELEVSKICLGTMTFGEQNTEADAHEQLDYALNQGVNIIDTAELYAVPSNKKNSGLTEKFIGTWLNKTKQRDKIVLATKIAGPSRGLKYIREQLNYSTENLKQAVEGSLNRLQTDYIDIYQLHWPERTANFFSKRAYVYDPQDEWIDNFLRVIQDLNNLIDEGKIRYWGLSNETAWGAMRSLAVADKKQLKRCITIQNPYNLLNRQYEIGLAEINMREGLRLLPYSPMAFGLLSGKYHNKTDKEDDRLNKYKHMARYSSQQCYDAVAEYLKLANDLGLSLAQLSLAFINRQPFVASNIIGATNLAQLEENIKSINVNLSEEALARIDQIQEMFPNPAP